MCVCVYVRVLQECKCNGHAESCHFDISVWLRSGQRSGGVCHCLHNTTGQHCQQCQGGLYRHPERPLTSANSCTRKTSPQHTHILISRWFKCDLRLNGCQGVESFPEKFFFKFIKYLVMPEGIDLRKKPLKQFKGNLPVFSFSSFDLRFLSHAVLTDCMCARFVFRYLFVKLSQEHVRVQELCTFENTLIHTCACAHTHTHTHGGCLA